MDDVNEAGDAEVAGANEADKAEANDADNPFDCTTSRICCR